MAPVIYKIARSPPSRAVMMVAKLTRAPVIYKDVDLAKREQFEPDFLKKNPLHSVPFLEDGDLLLSDSHAISAYLVEAYGKNEQAKLYPKELKKRAIVDAKLHFDGGIFFPRTLRIARNVTLFGAVGGTANEIEELNEAYSFLEAFLSRSEWLAGDHLTIADICAATSLSFANIFAQLNSEKFAKVATWQQKMNALPWFHETNSPGEEILGAIYKQRLMDNANKLKNESKP